MSSEFLLRDAGFSTVAEGFDAPDDILYRKRTIFDSNLLYWNFSFDNSR
jgi:hypothetical protein